MIHLAELNENDICVGVKTVRKAINDGMHIEIESPNFEYYSFRKYENGKWSEEKYVPNHAQIELDHMEALEQSQADQDAIIMDLVLGRL